MRPSPIRMTLLATAALALAGCAGDLSQQLTRSPELQTRVMNVIASNPDLATRMVDRLAGNDTTRTQLVNQVLANGAAAQEIMARVARDRTMLDGVVNFAVQDSATRDHVLSVFQGIQMAR